MDLELSADDFDLLKRVLTRYVSELRMEIADTDNYSWRQDMHADEDRAKQLLARLAEPQASNQQEGQLHIIVRGFVARLS